jgi:hypothetical protein
MLLDDNGRAQADQVAPADRGCDNLASDMDNKLG